MKNLPIVKRCVKGHRYEGEACGTCAGVSGISPAEAIEEEAEKVNEEVEEDSLDPEDYADVPAIETLERRGECVVCGAEFFYPVQRGRPPITCSEDCRIQRHGEQLDAHRAARPRTEADPELEPEYFAAIRRALKED